MADFIMINQLALWLQLISFAALFPAACVPQETPDNLLTIAFYNVENLFDVHDDPDTMDEDFTESGKNQYTRRVYEHKLSNLAEVISRIGLEKTGTGPTLIGLAEIENFTVLQDLARHPLMAKNQYRIIHYDSPDRRGIDVALLYREASFYPLEHEALEVRLWNEKGERLYTRDILWVNGILEGHEIHLFINHWPSRRGGQSKSAPKRSKAAYVHRKAMERICSSNAGAQFIVMGDFNDNPSDKSIRNELMAVSDRQNSNCPSLFNPMLKMFSWGMNSLAYRNDLHLFDQILLSDSLNGPLKNPNGLIFVQAGIFNPWYLIQHRGRYKGYPFRSFENGHFTGGYSDHYPVYVYLKVNSDP